MADEEHSFPPIISKKLFDLAQKKRAARNRPYNRGRAITAPYYLSGLAVCVCGHNLQGQSKKSSKAKGYRRYRYYTCGGYYRKGRTVCEPYLIPRQDLERPVLQALAQRLDSMGRTGYIRARIKEELTRQAGPNGRSAAFYRKKITEIQKRTEKWEAAIERGLKMDVAVQKMNELSKEKELLESKLQAAELTENLDVDVDAVVDELSKSLDNLHEVLAEGTVPEVKAVLRAYIGRIEVDPFKGKARIGFLRLPIRAFLSGCAPESARFSVVAGARFDTDPPSIENWADVPIAA